MLEHTRPNLRILHHLPRVNEIAYDVDENPKAYYFQQAQNGLYARQAILCDVLGITLNLSLIHIFFKRITGMSPRKFRTIKVFPNLIE